MKTTYRLRGTLALRLRYTQPDVVLMGPGATFPHIGPTPTKQRPGLTGLAALSPPPAPTGSVKGLPGIFASNAHQ